MVEAHGTAASENIYVWVTGSRAFYSYNTTTGALTALASFPVAADLGGNGEMVYVPSADGAGFGFIYVMSGCSGEPRYYSILTNTWYTLPDPHSNSNCVGHGTYDYSRNRLYVAGGDSRAWIYQY
jgi:hypothetical protein